MAEKKTSILDNLRVLSFIEKMAAYLVIGILPVEVKGEQREYLDLRAAQALTEGYPDSYGKGVDIPIKFFEPLIEAFHQVPREGRYEDGKLLAEFEKNTSNKIRVSLRFFKESEYVDVRQFYLSGNEYKPSPKGITVPADLVDDFEQALKTAYDMYKEETK